MNQLLEQLQKEFDEKFGKPQPDEDGALFHERSIGHSAGCDDCFTNQLEREQHKLFLTSSHNRIIEKFREMVESERKKGSWDYESNREILSYNEALDDILSTLIEQK